MNTIFLVSLIFAFIAGFVFAQNVDSNGKSVVVVVDGDDILDDQETDDENLVKDKVPDNQPPKKFVSLAGGVPDLTKQIPYAFPCQCVDLECKCCAGIQIYGLGIDRRACAALTYMPAEAAINMNLLMNDNSIYQGKFSTFDRQMCVPIIPVSLVGPVDVCVRMFDMTVVEQRLHACLSMLARVAAYPVMVLQFNCMEMGAGGVGLTRPIGGNYTGSAIYPLGNDTYSTNATTETTQQDIDVLDPVAERISTMKPQL